MSPDPSSLPVSPRAPFDRWPNGVRFGVDAGTVWFAPEAVLCVQTDSESVDLPVARAYVEAIRRVRDAEAATIERAGGLRIYQDLRSIRGVSRDARSYLVDAARADFGRWNLVSNKVELAPQTPLVHLTVQLVSRTTSHMGLRALEISTDLARDLERDGIRAPEAFSRP